MPTNKAHLHIPCARPPHEIIPLADELGGHRAQRQALREVPTNEGVQFISREGGLGRGGGRLLFALLLLLLLLRGGVTSVKRFLKEAWGYYRNVARGRW